MIFQSNSSEGDRFLQGMQNTERRWRYSREMFEKFTEGIGIQSWHIHDGWVRFGYNSGSDVLENEKIKLTWITNHAGYSHSYRMPSRGEIVAIIKDSPDIEKLNFFDMYVYEVVDMARDQILSYMPTFTLKRVGIVQVIFNLEEKRYELYVSPKKKTIGFFKRIFSKKKEDPVYYPSKQHIPWHNYDLSDEEYLRRKELGIIK